MGNYLVWVYSTETQQYSKLDSVFDTLTEAEEVCDDLGASGISSIAQHRNHPKPSK